MKKRGRILSLLLVILFVLGGCFPKRRNRPPNLQLQKAIIDLKG